MYNLNIAHYEQESVVVKQDVYEHPQHDCFEGMDNTEILKDAMQYFKHFYESSGCKERLDRVEHVVCMEDNEVQMCNNIEHELAIRRANLESDGQVFFDPTTKTNHVAGYYVPKADGSGLIQDPINLDYNLVDEKGAVNADDTSALSQMISRGCDESDYGIYALKQLYNSIKSRSKGGNIVVYGSGGAHDAYTLVHELGHRFVDESIVLRQKITFDQKLAANKSIYLDYINYTYAGSDFYDTAVEYVNHDFDSGEVIANFFALRYFLDKITNLKPGDYIEKKHILAFYDYTDWAYKNAPSTYAQCERVKTFLEYVAGVKVSQGPVFDLGVLRWLDERIC